MAEFSFCRCFLIFSYLTIAFYSQSDGNLFQLCEQLDYYNHLSLLECFRYSSYGCWCGPGGSGKPVDGIDDCCMHHDHCYDHARVSSHDRCLGYIDIYSFKDGKCLDPKDSCKYELCQCDATIAKCVSNFSYNSKYEFYRFSGHCHNTTFDPQEITAYHALEKKLKKSKELPNVKTKINKD